MTIDWPLSLLSEIAERRCAFVLGAGASAGCEAPDGSRPPDWATFLQRAIHRLPDGETRDAAERLLVEGAYLDAAQVVVDALSPPDFAQFVREQLDIPAYEPSEIHKLVIQIDPKIVITTNYDRIYERFAQQGAAAAGYNVSRYYDSHLLNDLRSDRRIIAKAHGCVSDPQKIVLTRRQYFDAQRLYPEFFACLDAIFLTSTLLFLGTGFSGDPDIELLLQNVNISAPSQHPHYALVESGRHSSVLTAMQHTYNVRFIEYPQGRHDMAVEALQRLSDDVQAHRAVSASV